MKSHDFDWNLLKSYLAVADQGSLSGAARVTGISQPTLGRHVAKLEMRLGITLFERMGNGMALTDAGSNLLDRAREVAGSAAALSYAASGQSQTLSGTVRITASQVVSHNFLPEIVADLRREEPELEVEIVSSDQVQNLLRRDADIAVRMIKPVQGELIRKKVNEMAIGAFAAKSYLSRSGTPTRVEDLFDHDLIGFDRSDLMIRGMNNLGHAVERSNFSVRTDAQTVYWRLLESGAGIGFGSVYLGIGNPGLERVLPELPIEPLAMWITAHRELRTSLRLRRVYDFLHDRLQALPLSNPGRKLV